MEKSTIRILQSGGDELCFHLRLVQDFLFFTSVFLVASGSFVLAVVLAFLSHRSCNIVPATPFIQGEAREERMPESSETEEDEDFANLGMVNDELSEDEDHVDPPPRKKKKSSNPGCLFANGCGFWSDDRSQLKTVVESAASKKKVGDDWRCDPTMFGLILGWAHKPSFNFAADVRNSNFVVAHEIKLESAFDPCRLRGWILTRLRKPKEASFRLECKRIHVCLLEAGFPPNHHALQLKGVIQAHCQNLETAVLPSTPQKPPTATVITQLESDITTTEADDDMPGFLLAAKKSSVSSASKKRKNVPASPEFELLHVHDVGSFCQRLTQNRKCLQIALFLIEFIFSSADVVPIAADDEAKLTVCFSMFSGCCSSRKFVELCHGLLLLFDGPTPAPDKVPELSRVVHPDSNVKLTDCVSGMVSFSPAETVSLKLKTEAEIDGQFPVNASKNQHNKRPLAKQLSIMRCVVLSMFAKFTGNEPSTSNMCPGPKPDSELRKTLTDPMVVTLDGKEVAPTGPEVGAVNPRTAQKEPRNKILRRKPPPSIQVLRPAVLDELATEAPTNFDGQTLAMTSVKDPTLARTHDSHCQDLDKRFDPVHCRIATANEVAPFASRVHVEGDPHGTNLCCGPMEMRLLRDLKHLHHGFKCDDQGLLPSIGKCSASLEVPMAISHATDDIAVLQPGHVIFSKSFSKESLHVNLPLCVKFVIEHGSSNRARDGDGSEWGTRIDFGCAAGSGHEEIADGVWRPHRLCPWRDASEVLKHLSRGFAVARKIWSMMLPTAVVNNHKRNVMQETPKLQQLRPSELSSTAIALAA
jgi:hypothetical protein